MHVLSYRGSHVNHVALHSLETFEFITSLKFVRGFALPFASVRHWHHSRTPTCNDTNAYEYMFPGPSNATTSQEVRVRRKVVSSSLVNKFPVMSSVGNGENSQTTIWNGLRRENYDKIYHELMTESIFYNGFNSGEVWAPFFLSYYFKQRWPWSANS